MSLGEKVLDKSVVLFQNGVVVIIATECLQVRRSANGREGKANSNQGTSILGKLLFPIAIDEGNRRLYNQQEFFIFAFLIQSCKKLTLKKQLANKASVAIYS